MGAFRDNVTVAQQDVFSIAPYAHATIEVLPATRLTLGGRFTYEKREQYGQQRLLTAAGARVGATTTVDQSIVARKPTWRVSVDHQFRDVLGYISYNLGFKSGCANLTSVTAPLYRPEQLDARWDSNRRWPTVVFV
jgi:iron complex outermembrane recepter protein